MSQGISGESRPRPSHFRKSIKIDEGENILRTGDKAIINFKFLHKPEYIKPNFKIIFRENHIRGIGIITEIL